MTEKRFTIIYNEHIEMMQYVDNQKEEPNRWAIWNANETVQKLNNLSDENEQLKQFKEDVFNKIDMHLRMLPTARDNVNGEYDDISLYNGAIYMLETLRKELQMND